MPPAVPATRLTMTIADYTEALASHTFSGYPTAWVKKPEPLSRTLVTAIDNIKQITNKSWLLEIPSASEPEYYSAISPIGNHLKRTTHNTTNNSNNNRNNGNTNVIHPTNNESSFSLFDKSLYETTTTSTVGDNDSDISSIHLDLSDSAYDASSETDFNSDTSEASSFLTSDESTASVDNSVESSWKPTTTTMNNNNNRSGRHAELEELIYQMLKCCHTWSTIQDFKEIEAYDADESGEGGVSLHATWP